MQPVIMLTVDGRTHLPIFMRADRALAGSIARMTMSYWHKLLKVWKAVHLIRNLKRISQWSTIIGLAVSVPVGCVIS